jgi:predicted membrane chloride channel (bestrophin family)
MKFFKSLILIFNLKSLIVIILAGASTWACIHFEYKANFPLTLVGIAVVFPIVFSISGAYKRREDALKMYGTIKAHGRGLYYASRDWVPDADDKYQEKLKNLLEEFFVGLRDYFQTVNKDERISKEKNIYSIFTKLSLFIKQYRDRGLPSGEVSRSNQFLSKMIDAFESIKHIYQYRTPITLRSYSKIFVVLVPIVYGPYFAHISENITMSLAMIMPILFSIVLVSLDNIQDHLENPFDQVGEDDVKINAEKFVNNLEFSKDLPVI